MKISPLLLFIVLFNACRAQEPTTYWKAVRVGKVDSQPYRGITASYMDMLVEMQMHLSKTGDELTFGFPFEKSVKELDLKSFTDARIAATGELLDSIHSITVENDTLKMLFYYQGTAEADKLFCLSFVQQDKQTYMAELEQLKAQRHSPQAHFHTLDLDQLDLATQHLPQPGSMPLGTVNPTQLADELTENEHSTKAISRTFEFRKGDERLTYHNVGIENSAEPLAHLDGVGFHTVEYISDEKSKQTQALILRQENLKKAEILKLYDHFMQQNATAKVEQFGLPSLYDDGAVLGIHSFMAITLRGEHQTLKFALDHVPDVLFDAELHNNVAVPFRPTPEDIKKIFRYYLALMDENSLNIFIVANGFDELLQAKQNSSEALTSGNIHNYVFKWTRLTDIWDKQDN